MGRRDPTRNEGRGSTSAKRTSVRERSPAIWVVQFPGYREGGQKLLLSALCKDLGNLMLLHERFQPVIKLSRADPIPNPAGIHNLPSDSSRVFAFVRFDQANQGLDILQELRAMIGGALSVLDNHSKLLGGVVREPEKEVE